MLLNGFMWLLQCFFLLLFILGDMKLYIIILCDMAPLTFPSKECHPFFQSNATDNLFNNPSKGNPIKGERDEETYVTFEAKSFDLDQPWIVSDILK